jgi:hypothetical protein
MHPPLIALALIALALCPAGAARAETLTYTCSYDSYSNEKGVHKVQDTFKLVFTIDTTRETAQSIGPRGPINVELLYAPEGGLTFVEAVEGGKVLVTSIDRSENSVHSRNIILQGRVSPSQYYGSCSKR